jgi:DNA-binding IclR family transcriptional regulator
MLTAIMDRAVARSFQLLEALARARGGARLSDLAVETGLQKSTAHRILGTLCALGYAEQDESSRYRASLKVWELGAGVVAELPIRRAAAGFLQSLHRATAETVSLTILSGDDVVYLEKLVAPRPVRFLTRVGSRVPAALTAGGKALLAMRPDAAEIVARTATRRPLDVPAVMAELDEARRRGYALSGYSPGVTSIGAAVVIGGAPAQAALSVSAPNDRLAGTRRDAAVEALLEACSRMAEALDHP